METIHRHIPASLLATVVALVALASVSHAADETTKKPQQLTSPVPEGLAKSDWQSIRAAHDAWQHGFRQVDGKWQALNPGQQWTTSFDGRGFLAKPKEAAWTWGLELRSYGFGEMQIGIQGRAETTVVGQRLSYQWQGGLEEWFVNDTRGLEHGFTLAARPEGAKADEPLTLTLATLGGLQPSVSANSQTVHFRDGAGASVLNYSGLKVWDADGIVLSSRFERTAGNEFRMVVEETGARYPLTIDPIAQQAYLKAGNNGYSSTDSFGTSVAVSGNTVVIGAPNEDSGSTGFNSTSNESAANSGAAYVFVRNGSDWSQQAYLKAGNAGASDNFGGSVSISGDTIIVGAGGEDSATTIVNGPVNESSGNSGAAYVFIRSGDQWSQQSFLKASNTGAEDAFGSAVAISDNTVIVGAAGEDGNSPSDDSLSDSGAAYVYVRNGTVWTQQAYLKAINRGYQSHFGTSDRFGTSVAIFADTLVVGAPQEKCGSSGVNTPQSGTAFQSGAAYVFTRSGSLWSHQAYLKASNTGSSDYFGISVAISGDCLAVGAHWEDSSTTVVNGTQNNNSSDAGAVYVFVRGGTNWTQEAFVKPANTGAGDNFGRSISLSGSTLVVGAPGEDSGTNGVNSPPDETSSNSGAAYVFVRSGSTWEQQAFIKAGNTGTFDGFGLSVAAGGDLVVAGAPGEDGNSPGINTSSNDNASNAGAAFVFERSGMSWSQLVYAKASNCPSSGSGEGDQFGSSVAVSGDTVVIGAPGESSSTAGANSTSNEDALGAGAVYVFVRGGGVWSQQTFLKASNTGAGDSFGSSVSISGNTLVVGAYNEDGGATGVSGASDESAANSGAAYVFERVGGIWTEQAYLKASNTGTGDFFGVCVSISGNTVVVGAREEDSSTAGVNPAPNENASASGAAYVFVRNGFVDAASLSEGRHTSGE